MTTRELASVASMMSRDVRSIGPDAPALAALEAMRSARISCVVVCEGREPIGIVTERDVVALATELLGAPTVQVRRVRDVMTTPIRRVNLSQTLDEALGLAEASRMRHLPVVDDAGGLVGILTQTDLLRAYTQRMERLVEERTLELAEANRRLEALSLQDGLLEIGNRRSLERDLQRLHSSYRRYRRPYATVLCDLDAFKLYNDRYGHLAGDDVLRRVAQRLREGLRGSDSIYRYGGEEILVALPETGLAAARRAAERLRAAVENLALPHEASPYRVVTLSCGVAAARLEEPLAPSWSEVVSAADASLYRAKSAGRNRVDPGAER